MMEEKKKVEPENAEEGKRFVCGMTGFFEFSRFGVWRAGGRCWAGCQGT